MTFGGTSLGCYAGGRSFSLVHLPPMRCIFLFNFLFMLVVLLILCNFLLCSERTS